MVPVQFNNHVARGLAYFTDQYANPANVPILQGLTSVYLRRIQDIENVLWQIINGRILANSPTGDQLTHLGILVGQPRGSLNDANLLIAVKLRILANKSNGCAEDIIHLLSAIAPGTSAYWEAPPMSFGAAVYNVQAPDLAQSVLTEAKPGGYYGQLVYTTWPDIGTDICLGSVYDSTAGESCTGSVYDSTAGGVLAAARVL